MNNRLERGYCTRYRTIKAAKKFRHLTDIIEMVDYSGIQPGQSAAGAWGSLTCLKQCRAHPTEGGKRGAILS